MKAATDPFVKGVLDGRQLALKVPRDWLAKRKLLAKSRDWRPHQMLDSDIC